MARKNITGIAVITALIAILITVSGLLTQVDAASPAGMPDISIQVTSRPQARLTWNKQDCDGYKVYRNSKAIARVEAGSADDMVSYVDDSIDPAGSYKYFVRSYNIEDGKEVYGSSSPVAEIIDGYTFAPADTGGVVLTGYTGHDRKLVIPDTIGGKAVTEIGEGCFSGNTWPQRVTVPEGVIRLGDYSFECCSLMQKIFLPDSLEAIGKGTFSGCGSLTVADMNEGVNSIGDGAFMACLDLRQIVLPASLKSIGKYSFALCESLSIVDFRAEYNTDLTEIPERAFYGCTDLQELELPSGISKIGKRAFFKCNELSSLSGKLSLTEIGDYAFEGTQIRNIYPILADDTLLGFGIFASNETDHFQAEYNDAEERYESCFDQGTHTFFPGSSILTEGAFYGSSINGVELFGSDTPANYQLINGSLYTSDGKTLLVYFPTEINEDYTYVETDESREGIFHVPEGVERIASYAFFNCGLKRIYLPSSIKEIGDNAFTRSGIDPDSGRIVDLDGEPLDLSDINVSDSAFDKWTLASEEGDYPQPPEQSEYSFEPAAHGPFPGTYSVTSLAGDRSLYRDEDFEGYSDITANFDEWCHAYIEANSDIMPMNHDLKTLAPYCHLYKGDGHYNQMASILNGDPEWILEAVKHAGYEYEEMYRIVDHGLLKELTRGRICGDLLLYSGVTQACAEALAGVEPGMPVTTDDLINAIGSVYTEKAMMSTSASSKVSYGFSVDSGVMFYILASHEALDSLGTFCVDCYNGASGNGGEEEILFNAGARLKVLDVGTSEYNVWGQTGTRTYVIMQLLEDEKDPCEPLDEMINIEEAEAEVAKAANAVASLPADADADQIKEAYEQLVFAQQALADALKEYSKVQASLSEEEKAALEGRISDMEKQIAALNKALSEATVVDISNYAVTLDKESYEYTGKAIRPAVKVSGLRPEDYTVSYSDNLKIGTASVSIKAAGDKYKGSITRTFKITKKTNPLSVKGKTAKVKFGKLKKKDQVLSVSKIITGTKTGHGKMSYKLVSAKKGSKSFSKHFKVKAGTGKLTVKKGLKKGTYKLKVKVRAAGDKVFRASPARTVTIKIIIK